MRTKNAVCVFVLVLIGAAMFNCSTNERINWPSNVLNSLWISKLSFDRHYSSQGGTYQVTYRLQACFPPNQLIYNTQAFMKERDWTRMANDPLNPEDKLSHAISPSGMTWETHPWVEYWKNQRGDVVYYHYSYEIGKVPFQSYLEELQKSCSLRAAVIFYPADIFGMVTRRKNP